MTQAVARIADSNRNIFINLRLSVSWSNKRVLPCRERVLSYRGRNGFCAQRNDFSGDKKEVKL